MGKPKTEVPLEETAFQKFERMAKKAVSVPQGEIQRREAAWRKRPKHKHP